MSWFSHGTSRAPRGPLPELGDDEADVPNPVTERPLPDRFCDLVLTGGIASGVVYPWAIVELARAFHFKTIGGTSVGAMAAALAAAAEYGRRCGASAPFEVMRCLPGKLAEDAGDGRTLMLALFQPEPRCERLFGLFIDAVQVFGGRCRPRPGQRWAWLLRSLWAFRSEAMASAGVATLGCALVGVSVVVLQAAQGRSHGWSWLFALLPVAAIAALVGIVRGLLGDVRHGLIANDLGLVRGATMAGQGDRHPGLVDWLHDGIQRSAGFLPNDPRSRPLTFRDLWRAPAYAGAPPRDMPFTDLRKDRSINLEMITTNITHGRPYRLPLDDEPTRLYFRKGDLEPFFPADVMDAMMRVAQPYQPPPGSNPAQEGREAFFELPDADLPIVVAARLSLSFPLLFSAVPLYAIDGEMPPGQRELKRCRFSDGGICSNFPIHLFDASVPRWPTFGMWLCKRSPYTDTAVWLPRNHLSGYADSWNRFEPPRGEASPSWRTLAGFLGNVVSTAKDWNDRTNLRMPNVRTRVARLNLALGEGELNIAMPRKDILQMAQRYGTQAGRLLVDEFVAAPGESVKPAWSEHQWVRLHVLLQSLREHLNGFSEASRYMAHSLPLRALIDRATQRGPGVDPQAISPVRLPGSELDPTAQTLRPEQAEALLKMLDAVEDLEGALSRCTVALPYSAVPTPGLRVRPPI